MLTRLIKVVYLQVVVFFSSDVQEKIMRKRIGWLLAIVVFLLSPFTAKAYEASKVRIQYEEYEARFAAIKTIDDVAENGFEVIESQMFAEVFESFSQEPITFFVAKDKTYNRLAVFLMDETGKILYKTNQLEVNYRIRGEMKQPIKEIAAVSFVDLNWDNQKEIVLITKCENETGEAIGNTYKVGDVLFQKNGSFYRDYRISEKINRFSMNNSAKSIISFVRDGKSTEFLYTATTAQELLDNGLVLVEEQCYTRNFEKLGRLRVVPGTYSMGDYEVFMVYLINEQGNIAWSFQPMGDYESFYSLLGMSYKDLDGDGMKDIAILTRCSNEQDNGEMLISSHCSIYYQRTGGFDEDKEFAKTFQCTDEHRMSDLVSAIRKYWGWQIEEQTDSMDTGIYDAKGKKYNR